jgi:hypothetical protein
MARKIELRKIILPNGVGTNGETEPQIVSYEVLLREILRRAPPAGLSYDDVVRSVEALRPIEEAIEAGADHVVLSDEQWRTLRTKLEVFPFGVADQIIVDFGMMIRNAPEIGT